MQHADPRHVSETLGAERRPSLGWLGEFELIAGLKRGAMATLYRARRYGASGFTRDLAIKVLHDHLAQNERYLAMFADEARISARLSHPNIVRVDSFGSDRGVHYLVMEYIDGCSVNGLLKMVRKTGRIITPDAAVWIAMEIAEALHAAHQAVDDSGAPLGLIHRDVCPSNVLLSRNGHVKLIDFGIAKAHGRIGQTLNGDSIKGKLRYMAPEQAIGEELDRRADIYSLGIVLWELLAGRQLFSAKTEVELFERVANPDVVKPSSFNPEVPEALDELTLSMLARTREARPATAYIARRCLREAAPNRMQCDSASVARLVEATIDATRVPEVHTPVHSFERMHDTAPPPRERVHRSRLGPRHAVVSPTPGSSVKKKASGSSLAMWIVGSISVTAAAVVAGLWLSVVIGPDDQSEAGQPGSGEPASLASQPAQLPSENSTAKPVEAQPVAAVDSVNDGLPSAASSVADRETDAPIDEAAKASGKQPTKSRAHSATKTRTPAKRTPPANSRDVEPRRQAGAVLVADTFDDPHEASSESGKAKKPQTKSSTRPPTSKSNGVSIATEFD